MKRVFITGASGFIGGYVVQTFIAEGWSVLALTHRTGSAALDRFALAGSVAIIRGDVTDTPRLKTALIAGLGKTGGHLDVIVHCAGRASDIGWPRAFRRTHYESTVGLIGLARELNVGRFVFISTTDVYGLRDFHGEAEDELPLRPCPRNPYPAYKIAAEDFIRRELPSDRWAIVRPAQVWGVGDKTLTPRIVDFLRGSPWIVHFGKWRGRNRWPLAHVRNVAMTAFLAATQPEAAGQAINVADEEKTTVDEFYRILARLFLPRKEFRNLALPFWVGCCFGGLVSVLSNALNLDRPFMDPSYYAVYAVSRNLDFGNGRMKALFRNARRRVVTRDEGIRELEQALESSKGPYSTPTR